MKDKPVLSFLPLIIHLSALSSLLCTNQCNNPRQFGTLVELFSLDAVVHVLACRNVVAHLEHAVLKCEKLAQCVVKEGSREGDVGW